MIMSKQAIHSLYPSLTRLCNSIYDNRDIMDENNTVLVDNNTVFKIGVDKEEYEYYIKISILTYSGKLNKQIEIPLYKLTYISDLIEIFDISNNTLMISMYRNVVSNIYNNMDKEIYLLVKNIHDILYRIDCNIKSGKDISDMNSVEDRIFMFNSILEK